VINEDSIVKDDILIDVMEIENSLVLITQNHGILEIKDDNLLSKPFSANDILNTKSIYSSLKLQDGQIAIGTVSNGFYLLDNMGKINMHLTQQEGLSNNTILSLFEDADGNIWLGLDNGVSVINLNSAFSVYKDTSGTLGTVYASAVFGGSIYLGTNQGLFYRKIGDQGKFMMIEGTSGQVWTLKTINGELFVGHNLGTFNVKNASVKWVSKVPGTWDIKAIPDKDNLLIQGNYDGLYILRKEDGNWKLANKLKGFEMSSRYFEFVDSNNILVSHEYKGIYNLTIDESFKNVSNSAPVEVPTGLKSSLIAFNNHIFYAYPGGMLVYSEDNEFTISSDIDEKLEQDSVYISGKLVNDVSNNRLWRFTENGLIYYSQRNLDGLLTRNFVPFPVSKRKEMQGFENILNLGEERYLLGSVDGFVIVNLEELGTESYAIELNSVKNSGNRNNSVLKNLSAETEFDASENSLEFSYNVASYNKFKGVDYQYRLLGFYNEWSAWSNEQTVNFDNLPFGDYIFEVRARVGDQLTQNNERYSFKISRPWYLSFLAIASYIIGVILLLLLLNLRNNRHYRNKELRLKLENERKLELSQSKSEKEVMRLENEKLENNFKSNSRELAASAMSIVKKNELLTTIKKDLLPIKEVPQAKRVMRTIDKNLSDKEDWQFFEEAFTNADKDFFNTLKENHPKLTPKDMKLCAYLRLNLSSKEIAPLLNISTRSVEIKRYRLRKKLSLQHEKSLVEYIMMI
ncbi:MAG: triple tyrosine motif-containing protein, partial [Leeuwenhoekiella sp.]